ncbi:hypothetical protein GCM10022630_17200 [Thermobifida alba]
MVADHLPDPVGADVERGGGFPEGEPLAHERIDVAVDRCHGSNLAHPAPGHLPSPAVIAVGVHIGPLPPYHLGDLECERKRNPREPDGTG